MPPQSARRGSPRRRRRRSAPEAWVVQGVGLLLSRLRPANVSLTPQRKEGKWDTTPMGGWWLRGGVPLALFALLRGQSPKQPMPLTHENPINSPRLACLFHLMVLSIRSASGLKNVPGDSLKGSRKGWFNSGSCQLTNNSHQLVLGGSFRSSSGCTHRDQRLARISSTHLAPPAWR